MLVSIPDALNAIEEYLRQVKQFDERVVADCEEMLLSTWYIENKQIQMQIIQTAAYNIGFLED